MDEAEAFNLENARNSTFPDAIPHPVLLHPSANDELRSKMDEEVPEPPQIDRAQRTFHSIEEAESALGRPVDRRLEFVFKQPRFEQRTPDWHLARQTAITASDFGAAAGLAEYGNPTTIFRKKAASNPEQFSAFALKCMAHGVKYEDAAAYRYEQESGEVIIDFGLLTHWKLYEMRPNDIPMTEWHRLIHAEERPESISEKDWETVLDLRWLKGSPDGITTSGILIEIKCPSGKFQPGKIREMYRAQVQLNMEISNCDVCHFIQYIPRDTWIFPERFDYFTVLRDGTWFQHAKNEARKCWDWVTHFRKTGELPEELKRKIRIVEDTTNSGQVEFESTRKRKVSSSPPKKRPPKYEREYENITFLVEANPSPPTFDVGNDAEFVSDEDEEWNMAAIRAVEMLESAHAAAKTVENLPDNVISIADDEMNAALQRFREFSATAASST